MDGRDAALGRPVQDEISEVEDTEMLVVTGLLEVDYATTQPAASSPMERSSWKTMG